MFANPFRPRVIVGTLPVTLTNGTVADATQVMSDLTWIVNQVNANAAPLANTALLNASNNFTQPQVGVAATSGVNFPIASQVQNQVFNTLSSTLGTNTITARVAALPLTAYAVGQVFTFTPSQTNTGPTNIIIDSAGSSIIFSGGSTLVGGELWAGIPAVLERDSTRLNLLAPGKPARTDASQNFYGPQIFNGQLIVRGVASVAAANQISIDQPQANQGRLIVYGQDAATNGTLVVASERSNGSNFLNILTTDTSGNITVTNNLTVSGSLAATLATPQVAKAWVHFSAAPSACSIYGTPLNVSSVTYNSAGNYTVNFTANMADTNYAFSGVGGISGTSLGSMQWVSQTVSAFRFISSNAGTPTDSTHVTALFFGN